MDRPRIERYAATILELGDDAPIDVDLRLPAGDHDLARIRRAAGASSFTVITAENPRGVARSAEENAAATVALRRLLEREGQPIVACAGRDPDGTHREEGFAVAGAPEPLLELARALHQDAVFRFDGARFTLVDVADGREYGLPLDRPGGGPGTRIQI